MPRPSRSFVLTLFAGAVALGTARAVAGDLASLHRRASAGTTPILSAVRDMPMGTVVTMADVEVHRVHDPVAGALPSARAAVGRVVAVPVLSGTPVLGRHLAPSGRAGAAAVVPRGMRAVRVAVVPEWRLPPGAVVDVLAAGDPAGLGMGPEPARPVVEGAVVLEDPKGDAVTLLVTVDAARRVAAAAGGPFALALAPPEDACCRTSSSDSSRG